MDLDNEELRPTKEINKKNKYKLTIYFIGETVFTTEFENIKDVRKFQDLIENKEKMQRCNNFIRTAKDIEGINVANINAYQIKEMEE